MSNFFTQLGSLISGIREKLHGASNTHPEPEPEQTINEDIEPQSPILKSIRENNAGRIFPTGLGLGSILSSFQKPIDIIRNKTPAKKVVVAEPETPAESSSRQQKRAEARTQKKAENKKPYNIPEKEIIFQEINQSDWMKRKNII